VAGLNDDAQWMVLLALIICISIFSLAVIINDSVLVGQTTAESVLDFSKSDIQGLHGELLRSVVYSDDFTTAASDINSTKSDIEALYLIRKHALVNIEVDNTSMTAGTGLNITIYYNNGVTNYHETMVIRQ